VKTFDADTPQKYRVFHGRMLPDIQSGKTIFMEKCAVGGTRFEIVEFGMPRGVRYLEAKIGTIRADALTEADFDKYSRREELDRECASYSEEDRQTMLAAYEYLEQRDNKLKKQLLELSSPPDPNSMLGMASKRFTTPPEEQGPLSSRWQAWMKELSLDPDARRVLPVEWTHVQPEPES
jgi:hypothetical protein